MGYVLLGGPQYGYCTRDICTQRDGERLLLIATSTGEIAEIENPYATILSIVRPLSPTSAVFTTVKTDDAPELVTLALSGGRQELGEYTVLKKPSDWAHTLPASVVSRADAHALDGGNIHVSSCSVLPEAGGYTGREDEKPPGREHS